MSESSPFWPKNDGEKWSRKNYFEIPYRGERKSSMFPILDTNLWQCPITHPEFQGNQSRKV